MLNILQPSSSGTTSGIYRIIGLLKENRDNIVSIIKLEKPDGNESSSFSFIAILREKNTLGQMIAFLNSWGTNFGPVSGGSGILGYCSMMSFIEDSELDIYLDEIKWSKLAPEIQHSLESTSEAERLSGWNAIVVERCNNIEHLFPCCKYPINSKWASKYHKCKGKPLLY